MIRRKNLFTFVRLSVPRGCGDDPRREARKRRNLAAADREAAKESIARSSLYEKQIEQDKLDNEIRQELRKRENAVLSIFKQLPNQSIEDALQKINKERYEKEMRSTKYPWRYTKNCTKCAIAYELRRGYDVCARSLSRIDDPFRFTWNNSISQDGGPLIGIPIYGSTGIEIMADAENVIRQFDEGARFIVQCGWKGGGAQLFNAELSGEVVRFIDPQVG